jgi:hypothetical protein
MFTYNHFKYSSFNIINSVLSFSRGDLRLSSYSMFISFGNLFAIFGRN